jgi:hypothetical protein
MFVSLNKNYYRLQGRVEQRSGVIVLMLLALILLPAGMLLHISVCSSPVWQSSGPCKSKALHNRRYRLVIEVSAEPTGLPTDRTTVESA